MKPTIHKLVGCTVARVTVPTGAYGLPQEVRIETSDGQIFTIDNDGVDGGEAGRYSGLNFSCRKKDRTMFDKNAQRRRAQELSATFAARGLTVPVLTMPPITAGVKDMCGTRIVVGCRVARAVNDKGSFIRVGQVTTVNADGVFLDHGATPVKYPERLLVLKI